MFILLSEITAILHCYVKQSSVYLINNEWKKFRLFFRDKVVLSSKDSWVENFLKADYLNNNLCHYCLSRTKSMFQKNVNNLNVFILTEMLVETLCSQWHITEKEQFKYN